VELPGGPRKWGGGTSKFLSRKHRRVRLRRPCTGGKEDIREQTCDTTNRHEQVKKKKNKRNEKDQKGSTKKTSRIMTKKREIDDGQKGLWWIFGGWGGRGWGGRYGDGRKINSIKWGCRDRGPRDLWINGGKILADDSGGKIAITNKQSRNPKGKTGGKDFLTRLGKRETDKKGKSQEGVRRGARNRDHFGEM